VFVAGFIGSPAMNLLAAWPSDGGVVLDGTSCRSTGRQQPG
jgi:hypothetical protein